MSRVGLISNTVVKIATFDYGGWLLCIELRHSDEDSVNCDTTSETRHVNKKRELRDVHIHT